MFFQPLPKRHPITAKFSFLPPDLQPSQIEGASAQYTVSDFGRMIGQLIPTDQYTVSLHHWFLDTSAHLLFPFEAFQPILLFNHSVPIPLRVNMEPSGSLSEMVTSRRMLFMPSKVYKIVVR